MKNRIPPLVFVLLYGVLMTLLARSPVALPIELPFSNLIAWVVGIAGAVMIAVAVRLFSAANTTVDPRQPHESTALVTDGIYRLTRNPMYAGMLLMLAGWAIALESLINLLLLLAFMLTINRLQIRAEETALAERFGDDYRDYCRRVRRWL